VNALCVALAFLGTPGTAQGYAPIVQGKKWGFISQQGRVVIQPQFDEARAFEGTMAAAKQGKKWGFVNPSGAWVVPPEFDFVGDFSEGAAAVVAGDRIGFVNSSGQFIIRPSLPWAFSDPPYLPAFKQGFAGVFVELERGGYAWRYLDLAGNSAFAGSFMFGSEFSEGLAAVSISAEAWGYVDREGKLIIEPKFTYAGPFRNGLAAVVKDKKMGYIDKMGAFVIPNKYDEALDFSEGLALVLEGERYKVIDTEGKQAFSNAFSEIDPLAMEVFRFSEGMLVFVEENDKGELLWGYVDRSGKVAIAPKFQFAGLFRSGLAPVTIRKGDDLLHGYIDKAGKYVWEPSK
jgi:hypothetical protein